MIYSTLFKYRMPECMTKQEHIQIDRQNLCQIEWQCKCHGGDRSKQRVFKFSLFPVLQNCSNWSVEQNLSEGLLWGWKLMWPKAATCGHLRPLAWKYMERPLAATRVAASGCKGLRVWNSNNARFAISMKYCLYAFLVIRKICVHIVYTCIYIWCIRVITSVYTYICIDGIAKVNSIKNLRVRDWRFKMSKISKQRYSYMSAETRICLNPDPTADFGRARDAAMIAEVWTVQTLCKQLDLASWLWP